MVCGDVVLINDDDMIPRSKWKKGVISKLIHGKDGIVRGAVIKCFIKNTHVEYERPIQRLIPFELIPESSAEDTSVPNLKDSPVEINDTHKGIAQRPRRRAAVEGEIRRRETDEI